MIILPILNLDECSLIEQYSKVVEESVTVIKYVDKHGHVW